jgi:hypothetical protein
MTDRYTKAVLTVIAVALVLIALQLGTPRATAQFGDGCGGQTNPCYVNTGLGARLSVTLD